MLPATPSYLLTPPPLTTHVWDYQHEKLKINKFGRTQYEGEVLHFFARDDYIADKINRSTSGGRRNRMYHHIDEYTSLIVERVHFCRMLPERAFLTIVRHWVGSLDDFTQRPWLHAETRMFTESRDRPPDDLTSESRSYIRQCLKRGARPPVVRDFVSSAAPPTEMLPGAPYPEIPLIQMSRIHLNLPAAPRPKGVKREERTRTALPDESYDASAL